MATKLADSNSYLRRPLYVYDLPTDLLETLTLRSTDSAVPRVDTEPPKPTAATTVVAPSECERTVQQHSTTLNDDGISNSSSCALCRASLRNVDEQRQHFRSDFHRYNLKLSTKGIPSIDEQTFIKQIGDLDESISGSDSSESETDDDREGKPGDRGDSTLTALLKKQAKISIEESDDDSSIMQRKKGPGGAPLVWFSSPKTGESTGLGIYRAIFSSVEQEQPKTHLVEVLKAKQVQPIHSRRGPEVQASQIANPSQTGHDPHFFLCMIGGGHFAAAIVGLAPEIRKGPGGIEERHAVIKVHKTFHRYTTRRKQGGSQSANDNAKGNAHSAGSSIRRYNEIALETDIRNVLAEWKELIGMAQLLFIRASGTTSRKTLFGPYDGQILNKNDSRIRGFPFNTRRATQGELLRAFHELTRVKVSAFAEIAETKPVAVEKQKTHKPKPVKPERSEEEEAAILHTSQLQNLIRRTKAPAMLLYLSKNEISADFEFFPPNEHHHSPRPLHLAASINSPALVRALLTQAKSNPKLTNVDGKTAYQIAGDGKTRDAFRVARHQLGEKAWDWQAAHIPSALSAEEAEAKIRREQEAADRVESERRKTDLAKIREQEEQRKVGQMEKKAGTGKALGAVIAEKTGSEKREEEARGFTPEMKQRMERERRARAAEARMKALSGQK